MRTTAVYVHIPFCTKKCGYCDFNAYSGYKEGTKARYVDALCREISARAEPSARISTVFFGGGTPTNLAADDLGRLLATVRSALAVDDDAEVSVEANPSDVDDTYLRTLLSHGFNRLSFGVQTFNDRLLKSIDRLHSGEEARQAVARARATGFDNLSLDLMFGLPRQTLGDWDRSIDEAFALDVPHLSMYGLIVEEGTPFYGRQQRGRLPLPSEKTEAAMFARAIERARAAGYHHYEVSNYARPGHECRHNQVYWRNEEYFGFGAGAVSYLDGARTTNERRPSCYIDVVNERGICIATEERLSPVEAMGETVMLALRMRDGLDLAAFARRYGVRADDHYADQIARFRNAGMLERTDGSLRLTERGLFLANEVMAAFL